MFDAKDYLAIFHVSVLFITVAIAVLIIQKSRLGKAVNVMHAGLALLIIVFLGTRPLDGIFTDMMLYAARYESARIRDLNFSTDTLFIYINYLMSDLLVLDVSYFFFFCSFIYVVFLAIAMNKAHRESGLVALLCFTGSFCFFAYGTNTIRAGMAASAAILAFSYHKKWPVMLLLMFAAVNLHASVTLPVLLFIFCRTYNNPFIFAMFWLACLAANVVIGESITAYFAKLIPVFNDEDMRLSNYSLGGGGGKGGFRWDFILYSVLPILVSWLLAEKKAKAIGFYRSLLCTYIGANAFWLLFMYAAYSDRIAYLSWFILPWLMIYPYLPSEEQPDGLGKRLALPGAESRLILLLIGHFLFTFLFWFVRRNM